jgi:hypothetical protein
MENNNISVFPNPPNHYKHFQNSDTALPPPDINMLSRVNSFMTFGKEYKLRELNFHKQLIETNFMDFYDKAKLADRNIPNLDITQKKDIDIFSTLEEEIQFLKKTYLSLLKNIRQNIEECEFENCLIKYTFQKIYHLIALLKRKQVFIETVKYFQNQIDKNNLIEKQLTENIEECKLTLQKGLKEVNEI